LVCGYKPPDELPAQLQRHRIEQSLRSIRNCAHRPDAERRLFCEPGAIDRSADRTALAWQSDSRQPDQSDRGGSVAVHSEGKSSRGYGELSRVDNGAFFLAGFEP